MTAPRPAAAELIVALYICGLSVERDHSGDRAHLANQVYDALSNARLGRMHLPVGMRDKNPLDMALRRVVNDGRKPDFRDEWSREGLLIRDTKQIARILLCPGDWHAYSHGLADMAKHYHLVLTAIAENGLGKPPSSRPSAPLSAGMVFQRRTTGRPPYLALVGKGSSPCSPTG